MRRTDTGAVVVAADTVVTHAATGTYTHTFADPAAGLVYQYIVKATVGVATHWFERRYAKPVLAYMNVDKADALAETTSGLVSWAEASDPAKAAAHQDPGAAPVWLPFQDVTSSNHIGQWATKIVGGVN